MIFEEQVSEPLIVQTSPEAEKPQVNLPIIKNMKRFDFTVLEKDQKKILKPKNKLLANIQAITLKRRKVLDDQSISMQKKKQTRTLNKTYKHVQPKYLQRLSNEKSRKTILPTLNSLNTLVQNDLESAKVLNDFKIISHVGKGMFSVVSSAINKNTQKKYAIKTYTRIDQMDDYKIKNIQLQVKNLFKLEHQNIISLAHAVKDGRKIQLVMENGGKQSLAGLLRKVKYFDERLTKKYFRQMVQGMVHCHEKNICHRDLKLENVLVDDQGKVKIIDFGFSTLCSSRGKLNTFCGTPPYMCPELAAKQPYNGPSADVWALGISLYLMLNGKFPFRAPDERQLYRLIQQGKYKVNMELSAPARSLIDSMLKVDESSRMTAEKVLESEWLCT